jgi:hypothetical protein
MVHVKQAHIDLAVGIVAKQVPASLTFWLTKSSSDLAPTLILYLTSSALSLALWRMTACFSGPSDDCIPRFVNNKSWTRTRAIDLGNFFVTNWKVNCYTLSNYKLQLAYRTFFSIDNILLASIMLFMASLSKRFC